ncbi:hypothetical protein BdWA1_000410 [Babesia duncani]|uniref:Uncharacterized protein n=1 Tax=Babesia duncani TaxID=323732 RepID=A0AAD9UQ25_9APIC|nr:hypothetical protein BdWA1_000410 [Babesia duncani]
MGKVSEHFAPRGRLVIPMAQHGPFLLVGPCCSCRRLTLSYAVSQCSWCFNTLSKWSLSAYRTFASKVH